MYTSGQFAIIGNVGRKALRIYREEGLLIPASVNEENGYYYYDERQLPALETIRRLRSVGLSLYEIKQVLSGKADEKAVVSSKIKELGGFLKDMKEMIGERRSGDVAPSPEPDIRPFASCTCLFVDENVDLEKLGMSVGTLYERAARKGIQTAGSHFVRYEGLRDDAEFSMRTCLPVAGYRGGDTLDIFEDSCLHLRFDGGFSKVSRAHDAINTFASEHGIDLSGRAYEAYNRDMSVDVYYPILRQESSTSATVR